jgi:predicted ferric reductase
MDTTQGQRQASDAITGAAQTFAPESYSTYFEDVFYPQSGVAAAPAAESAPVNLVAETVTPATLDYSTIATSVVAESVVVETAVAETVLATAVIPAPVRPAAPAPRGRHSVRPPMQRGLASRGGSTRRGDVAITIAGIGLGISLGLGVSSALAGLAFPGGVFLAASMFSALAGTYLCLCLLLLISRLPWLEREVGHDRMIQLHRKVAPYSILLIGLHAVFSTLGHAAGSVTGAPAAFWQLVTMTEWMVPATTALVLMISLGVISYRKIRAKMKYETWWVAHLYFYIAVALAFGHQIALGPMFINNPLQRNFWIGLYIFVAVMIFVNRFWNPYMFSRRHDLRIAAVVPESPDVTSVYISGEDLDLIKARGGQFFQWRFMTRHYWWQAHPYSLSASPNPSWLRVTVKNLGDQSGSVNQLRPRTRVWAEGPYGIFTAAQRSTERITAFAAGVGITPIRAVLDDLPPTTDVTVIYKVTQTDTAPLKAELDHIAAAYGWTVHYLEGPRDLHPMEPDYLYSLAPGMGRSDVYICGNDSFTESVIRAAQAMGVPDRRIHHEAFAF